MAKKIPYGLIHWSPKYNIREEYGVYSTELVLTEDSKTLCAKIALKGFDEAFPVHVTSGINDEQVADALVERQKILDRFAALLADNGSMEAGQRAETQAVYSFLLGEWKDAEGRLIAPQFIGLTGNRRSQIIRHAAAWRKIGVFDAVKAIEVPAGPFDSGIWAIIESMPYDADHMVQIQRIQIDENESASLQKKFTSLERLKIGRSMKLRGENQNALRYTFGATIAAGLWKFMELDAQFPSLGLWDAVHQPPKIATTGADGKTTQVKNPKWVNLDRLLSRYTVMQNMMERVKKSDVEAYNSTPKGQKNPRTVLTREEVREFMFNEQSGDKAVRDKVMDKNKIEAALKGSPILVVKLIAECILTNSLVLLEKLVDPRQFALNAVIAANDEQLSALNEAVKGIFTPEATQAAMENFEDLLQGVESTAGPKLIETTAVNVTGQTEPTEPTEPIQESAEAVTAKPAQEPVVVGAEPAPVTEKRKRK